MVSGAPTMIVRTNLIEPLLGLKYLYIFAISFAVKNLIEPLLGLKSF